MNTDKPNYSLFIIGIGSAILFHLSAYNGVNYSPFTENNSYHLSIKSLLLFSFGYFVIDFLLMLFNYKPQYKIYIFHHMIGIGSIIVGYFRCYHLIKYLIAYLTYELSTPFLHMAINNKKKGISNGHTKFIELCFFVSYTLVRIIFGTYLTYDLILVLLREDDLFLNFFIIPPIMLQVLIFYWYYRIIIIIYNKLPMEELDKLLCQFTEIFDAINGHCD
jgi:hypothetical protein